MTRILQIRRGSSAQNDNFTGLSGEITFDTTNKTLRVHDGETLGGAILAKLSDVENFLFGQNYLTHIKKLLFKNMKHSHKQFHQNLYS